VRKDTIIEMIEKIPGISYNEIVRNTGLSNGVISHYLIKLMESGEIEKEGIQRGKYFIKNIPKKDRNLITILRNRTNNDVIRYLLTKENSEDAINASTIAKKVKKSGSTISVSLKVLHKNKIIERKIMNKNLKLTNDIGYKISNIKLWTAYCVKYNL
tara:strand:- start:90 stop:560 length:471 start_codon:yes stop_codon:yes gene_type:complete